MSVIFRGVIHQQSVKHIKKENKGITLEVDDTKIHKIKIHLQFQLKPGPVLFCLHLFFQPTSTPSTQQSKIVFQLLPSDFLITNTEVT